MSTADYPQFSEVSIRAKPGEYVQFSIVDNKNLFQLCFRTDVDFGHVLQTRSTDEGFIYAVYNISFNIACLACSFSKRKELNKIAVDILKESYPDILEKLI